MIHPESDTRDPIRELRRHDEGVLTFDGRSSEVQYTVDSRTGRLVIPVERFALEHRDHVLFVPDDHHESLALIVNLRQANHRSEDAEACDRWTIYHPQKGSPVGGQPPGRVFAIAVVESVKFGEAVYDSEAFDLVNPLARVEGRLCRLANTDRRALIDACQRIANIAIVEPMVVGVDPRGMDVRARFGIIRLEFPDLVTTPEEAERAITGVLSAASSRPESRH